MTRGTGVVVVDSTKGDALVDPRRLGAEAIVIGIRHRTPVGEVLLGGVAQRVILDAACPVIAVKPG